MRNFLSQLLPFLLFILFFSLLFAVGFFVVAGVALGMGWVLRLLLPFTLFEAALLGLLFSVTGIYLLATLFRTFGVEENLSFPVMNNRLRPIPAEQKAYKALPSTRFYATPGERTWDAWLRREIANDIYMEFQDAPYTTSSMNDTQVQALAIRLADIALGVLKQKTQRAKHLKFNLATLKREMQRQGQRAYDDDILRLALNGINVNIEFYEDDLLELIRTQAWQQPAAVSEDKDS
jgi:hypothetical protein